MTEVYITLKEAKDHLNVDHDLDDTKIKTKTLEACAIVQDYIEGRRFRELTLTQRDVVKSATKLVLGALYENADGSQGNAPQPLSQSVKDLLMRIRRPAVA